MRGQAGAEPARDVLDERRVVDDQPVAERLVARAPVLEPEALAVVPATGREYELAAHSPQCGPHASDPIQTARAAAATAITHLRVPPRSKRDHGDEDRRRAAVKSARERSRRHGRMMPQLRRPPIQSTAATQGRSSIGRAPVSKTGGCRFESCRPCWVTDGCRAAAPAPYSGREHASRHLTTGAQSRGGAARTRVSPVSFAIEGRDEIRVTPLESNPACAVRGCSSRGRTALP